ncbi:hypothetical protein D3C75_959560 [compost metagenome]
MWFAFASTSVATGTLIEICHSPSFVTVTECCRHRGWRRFTHQIRCHRFLIFRRQMLRAQVNHHVHFAKRAALWRNTGREELLHILRRPATLR